MASIDKRPDGKWRARWREYPGGPQRTRHFTSQRDAKAFKAEVEVALARGSYLNRDQRSVTLDQYVEAFLARQVWRERSRLRAVQALRHCTAILGSGRPLSSIRRSDIEAMVVALSAGGMAPNGVRAVFQHTRSLMRSAAADGLVVVDPTQKIRLPERPQQHLVIPTPAEVHALVEAAPEGFGVAVVLGAFVGLRQGEAAGLKVEDVDWLRGVIHVRRQLVSQPTVALAEPKTRSSVRDVPVPRFVIDLLAAHVERHGANEDGLLLHGRDGQPVRSSRFAERWDSTRKAVGSILRFHDLRHAFASALIAQGCDVVTVSHALGHASPSVTLRVYAHLMPKSEDRVRAAIEAAWEAAEDPVRTEEEAVASKSQVAGHIGVTGA